MTTVLTVAVFAVTVAALVASAATLLATTRPLLALPVLLDLLLAACLLRLAVRPSTNQLAATALLVLVKRVVTIGFRQSSTASRFTDGEPEARRVV